MNFDEVSKIDSLHSPDLSVTMYGHCKEKLHVDHLMCFSRDSDWISAL